MRTRRRPTREELLDRLPRGLRPMLSKAQQDQLALYHNVNLDAIVSGQADASMLWDFLGGVLMWHKAAELIGAGVEEMAPQLGVAMRLVERYSRTGKVRFDGSDYQLARMGVLVMDELARLVDRANADRAAGWSQVECQRIADGVALAPAGRQVEQRVAA